MTKPTNASEWLETDVPYPHRTLLELRLVAMLRDARAELELSKETSRKILRCERLVDAQAFARDDVAYGGWSAIEEKFREGGYG